VTDITIQKGSTFSRVLRWESAPFISTPITAIARATPAVITAASHGLVTGWRAAVVSAGGMRQINAKSFPPRSTDFHKVTYVSATQVSLNDVDSSNFTLYTSGGFLVSYTPVSLASFTARMQIRATVETADPPLVSLVSPTDIVLDDTNHTITVTISAAVTAAYTFSTGVYDLELVSGDATPVVTKLLSGNVIVLPEVTR
jgi:hypothetical protein